jgi:hypothetical protein
MKKITIACFFLWCFLTVLPAQENPLITIVNNTGYTVYYVFISDSNSDTWGQDFLDSDQILENNQSAAFRLPYPLSRVKRYDIRLEDLDGDTYTKMNVAVASGSRIVFTFDDFDVQTEEIYNGPPITIVNNTGYTIYYINISRTTSENWGSDRLASNETLDNGQSISLNLPDPIDVTNRYDIRLKDSDGDTYTKMNVRVAANSRIVFTMADMD